MNNDLLLDEMLHTVESVVSFPDTFVILRYKWNSETARASVDRISNAMRIFQDAHLCLIDSMSSVDICFFTAFPAVHSLQ